MEKRVLIAILLSFLVLYGYQALFAPPPPDPKAKPAATATTTTSTGPSTGAETTPAAAAAASPAAPAASPVLADATERDVRVETQNVIATFTNRGARLKSWRLKKYQDRAHQGVELVANDVGDAHPLPFSLRVKDDAITRVLNSALYRVSGPASDEGPITAPAQLKFEYSDSSGLRAVKEFQLEPASYVVSFSASAASSEGNLSPTLDWGPGLGDRDGGAGRGAVAARGLFAVANEVTRVTPSAATETPTHQGD